MARVLPILLLAASAQASLFDFLYQKPLKAAQYNGADNKPQSQDAHSSWTLNFTSPHPHLFASVSTLLHQWSNTMFPNGHALVAVEIPAYTLLYHGLISPADRDPEPPSPEWLAFDLEMAYGIMGSARNSFLLTYQTTRPVKALYFDGESATLFGLGTMDSQMLQLFGNVSGPANGLGWGIQPEYLRAHGLCDWLERAGLRGRGWGFEGVVRMNAGFEMIWCDFVSPSLRLVSRMNVTAPLLPEEDEDADRAVPAEEEAERVDGVAELAKRGQDATSYYPLPPQPTKTDRNAEPSHPAAPPNMRWTRDHREPFLTMQGWGWFDSATWHYGSNRNGPGQGEVRAKVLQCGILSYYSAQFVNQTANRAAADEKSLNLTSSGLWEGPGEHGNRTTAIKQLTRRRRYHHLGMSTPKEAALMRSNSERALRSLLASENECSGADWTLITSEIVARTTNQLGMLDTKLASFPVHANNETEVYKWIFDLRAQSHLFLIPFLEYPEEITRRTWSTSTAYYRETHARCQYRYTRLLVPDELGSALTPEEHDIRRAIEEVYGTICGVLITMHFGIELAWLDTISHKAAPSASTALSPQVAATWRDNIAELVSWLGWENQYTGCKEQCAWDERCYIPIWPVMHRVGGPGRGPGGGGGRPPPGNETHDGPPGRGRGPGRGPPGGGGDGPPGRGPPGFDRRPESMHDDPDLWEPKCVNITFIMGER